MLGATPPVDLGFATTLLLSADGKSLFANYRGANAVVTFDVDKLLQAAALPASLLRDTPLDLIDQDGDKQIDIQVVRPGILLSAASQGIAASTSMPTLATLTGRYYGDVIEVDLRFEIGGTAVSGNHFFLILDSFVGGKVATVSYAGSDFALSRRMTK